MDLPHTHKREVRGLGKAPRIMRKFEMVLAARDVGEEQRAADEAEWAARRSGSFGGAEPSG